MIKPRCHTSYVAFAQDAATSASCALLRAGWLQKANLRGLVSRIRKGFGAQ